MALTERQLNMFKGKRQKGEAPPQAEEFHLHCLIADVLKRWAYPSWRYTHIPLGGYRKPVTANRLKRMGTMKGWPDFIFCHVRGRVCFLELKRRGGHTSAEQAELAHHLRVAGHGYLKADNFNEILAWLKAENIVPARISSYAPNSTDTRGTPWPGTGQESTIE